jgi:ABC-type polysaccharide/polyol phosphate export permease
VIFGAGNCGRFLLARAPRSNVSSTEAYLARGSMQESSMAVDDGPVRTSAGYAGARGEYRAALNDLRRGLALWPIWTSLAFLEVRQRYRRTLIGPYWTSISYAILIGAMAIVFSNLFHMNLAEYLPYLASGFIAWIFITSIVNDSSTVFVTSEGLLKNTALPPSLFVYAMLLRNSITMLHHLSVYAIIALIYLDVFSWNYLLVIPALFLIVLNGAWIGLGLGIIVARFRDVQQIVSSAIQILMFITPVFWPVEGVTERVRYFLVEPNIAYHAIAILRQPLLGKAPTLLNWEIMIALTIVGWTLVFLLFARLRRFLPFWI